MNKHLNMPPLPDGYFWRISKGPRYSRYHKVRLMKKLGRVPGILDKEIDSTGVHKNNFTDIEVHRVALYLLGRTSHFEETTEMNEHLFGDYY